MIEKLNPNIRYLLVNSLCKEQLVLCSFVWSDIILNEFHIKVSHRDMQKWAVSINSISILLWLLKINNKIYKNELLYCAAKHGKINMCIFLKNTFFADNFNLMLQGATEGGYKELSILAKKWGATCFENMIWYALKSQNTHLIDLALSWKENTSLSFLSFLNISSTHKNKKIKLY